MHFFTFCFRIFFHLKIQHHLILTMNTPSNKNKPYFLLQFRSETMYEGIGTSDCVSFGHHAKKGKAAYDAEMKFRAKHPEIQNVARSNDLHSWLNNPRVPLMLVYRF